MKGNVASSKSSIKFVANFSLMSFFLLTHSTNSNDVKTFLAACAKYGTGTYAGLTVGNEVSRFSSHLYSMPHFLAPDL